MAPNLALLSIPAYYLLSVSPHTYAVTLAANNNPDGLDNRNPRSTEFHQHLRKVMGPEKFGRWERAESAHKNNMENLPLYIGAVFAGLIADRAGAVLGGVPGAGFSSSAALGRVDQGVMKYVYAYFAARIAFNAAYITTSDNKYTWIRSALWIVTLGLSFEQFWRAAKALAE